MNIEKTKIYYTKDPFIRIEKTFKLDSLTYFKGNPLLTKQLFDKNTPAKISATANGLLIQIFDPPIEYVCLIPENRLLKIKLGFVKGLPEGKNEALLKARGIRGLKCIIYYANAQYELRILILTTFFSIKYFKNYNLLGDFFKEKYPKIYGAKLDLGEWKGKTSEKPKSLKDDYFTIERLEN